MPYNFNLNYGCFTPGGIHMPKKNRASKSASPQKKLKFNIDPQLILDIAVPVISAMLLIAVKIISDKFPLNDYLVVGLFLLPYLIAGFDTFKNALFNTLEGRHFSYDLLITVVTVCAFCIGEFSAAVVAMIVFRCGILLESLISRKCSSTFSRFSEILPKFARTDNGSELIKVYPELIKVGNVITVCPGDRIPLDGIVIRGSSKIDVSAYTGQNDPITIAAGQAVISGCLNLSDYIDVSVTKTFNESTVNTMLDYAENAATRKNALSKKLDGITRIITPVIVCAAILLTLIFSLVTKQWADCIMKGLVIIAVASTYVLSVSLPMCYYCGIGSAMNSGIFIKGPKCIDDLTKLNTVALDKTGTVTNGSFSVIGVEPIGISSEDLITLAAAAESYSNHPIAKALKRVCRNMPDKSLITNVTEVPGRGIKAKVCGRNVLVGNSALMTSNSITPRKFSGTATVIHVAADGIYGGYIVIDDRVKPGAKQALRDLYSLGVEKAVLLTGDAEDTGKAIGDALGVSDVMSELQPEDKSIAVKELQREKSTGTLAFVGDGLNDAAAFENADISISMGVIGADASIGKADAVIMDDAIGKLPLAVDISKHAVTAAKVNIALTAAAKLTIMILGLVGVFTLPAAVIADTVLLLLALLNAYRIYNIK